MSNLTRPLTVVRRRPNLLDLLIPKNSNTKGYRLQTSTTFSGGFATILTADISSGYLDPALVRDGRAQTLQAVNNRNYVRVVFDPTSFSITDTLPFWMKFVPVDYTGTPGTASSPMMILPEEKLRGDSVVTLAGAAPSGASVANSLTLLLPFRAQSIKIRNADSANSLFVATEIGGSETEVEGGAVTTSLFEMPVGAQGCLLVRGGGAIVNFSATFTSFLPL